MDASIILIVVFILALIIYSIILGTLYSRQKRLLNILNMHIEQYDKEKKQQTEFDVAMAQYVTTYSQVVITHEAYIKRLIQGDDEYVH